MPLLTEETIERWFTYHAPTPEQIIIYADIRLAAKRVAAAYNNGHDADRYTMNLRNLIGRSVPEGSERTVAMTFLQWATESNDDGQPRDAIRHLRGAVMWANAGVAVS